MARHNARNLPNKERRLMRRLWITVANALQPVLTLIGRSTGATGPSIQLYHNSASPNTADNLFRIYFDNNDSDITRENVGEFAQTLVSVTAGSEDAYWYLYNNRSAVLLFGGNGLYWSGADGQAAPGALGEMNCAGYYLDGERFPKSVVAVSGPQLLSDGGLITFAHGLGVTPSMIDMDLECVIGDAGYSIGDVVHTTSQMNSGATPGATMCAVYYDATNVYVRYYSALSANLTVRHKTTGASTLITLLNWRLNIKAYN